MSRTALRLAMIIAGVLAVVTGVGAAEKTIWQIGQFDNNYAEFAIAGDHRAYQSNFPNGTHFSVGQDDPAKAWPFIQPGPQDKGWAGKAAHPNRILFQLPDQPQGVFTLTVDFVSTQAIGAPTYEVTINGVRGTFILPTGPGDAVLTDASQGKEYILSIQLPPSLFKQGRNLIRLDVTRGSWAIYDALRLTNDPAASLPPITIDKLDLVPTPRVIRQDGKLKRIVKLSARLSRGMTVVTAAVKTDSFVRNVTLTPDSSGAAQAEVAIDDPSHPIRVEAAVTCEGVTKDSSWELQPQKLWKLYIQPFSHVDIGYTNYQELVALRHNDNMTHALDLCAQYPDFKWNTEAAWVEENYLSMVPEERKTEFIQRAREGRIGCSAIYGSMLTGLCSHEGLIRNMYYAHSTAKQYGIPFDMAVSCDVPTHVWTLPSVIAGSGIRYFSAGLNDFRDDTSKWPINMPFYWQGPDGSRVLTWFSSHYSWAMKLGLMADINEAESKIDDFLRGFDRNDYPYDAVFGYGGVGDNRDFDDSLASVADEWNKRYASPKIILCRGPEFFQYVEKNWKSKIPVISGDGGVCWEDGAASSALETGIARRATESLLAAEKLNALTTALGKPACSNLEFNAAWKNLILWDEHTWGASGSFHEPESDQTLHQWKVKSAFATDLAKQADAALRKGADALSKLFKVSEPSVVVFNPLSWATSSLVEAGTANGKTITFRAENVPPLGYKTYPVKSLPKVPASRSTFNARELTLSNRFYTLRVNPKTGAVASLRDNELNRELADTNAAYGINEYVYLLSNEKDRNHSTDVTRDQNTPPVRVSVEDRPGGKAVIIKGSAYNTPEWTSEIVLRDDEKRIDFINTLQKQETRGLDKEGGYFAFPFRLSKPRFHVELPDGVLRPDTQMRSGACMQWYCLQDFAAIEDNDCAVTWTAVDSPLITLSSINYRYNNHAQLPLDKGHLYAYVFNNVWSTNYKFAQGGQMVFRFSLTSSRKYDPVSSARFGQSVRSPLIATIINPARPKSRSAAHSTFSLCSVSPGNVEIQAVKQAESGKGIIIRLRELSGKKTRAILSLTPGKFKSAELCNLMEDPQAKLKIANGKLDVPLAANGLATVRVK